MREKIVDELHRVVPFEPLEHGAEDLAALVFALVNQCLQRVGSRRNPLFERLEQADADVDVPDETQGSADHAETIVAVADARCVAVVSKQQENHSNSSRRDASVVNRGCPSVENIRKVPVQNGKLRLQ